MNKYTSELYLIGFAYFQWTFRSNCLYL